MDETIAPLISQLDLHALLRIGAGRGRRSVVHSYRVHAYQWALAPKREPASTLQVGVALIGF